MPQQPQVSVSVAVAGLNETIARATDALRGLAESLQEDCGVDDLLWDEITRLRQELNGTRDELRKARAELKASQDRWQDLTKPGTAWWPMPVMGTAVPAPPAWVTTTGTNTSFPTACSPVWSAPVSGEYIFSVAPEMLSLPGTLTITSGGTSETISVSNVTLEGVKIDPAPLSEAPYAITRGRTYEWTESPQWTDQYGNRYGLSPTATEGDPPSA